MSGFDTLPEEIVQEIVESVSIISAASPGNLRARHGAFQRRSNGGAGEWAHWYD